MLGCRFTYHPTCHEKRTMFFFSTYTLLCLIQITHTGSYIITLSFIIYIKSYHLLPLVPLVSDFNWCNDSWLICMDLCDFVTCTAKTCCTHHITAIKNWNHNTHNKPLRMTSSPQALLLGAINLDMYDCMTDFCDTLWIKHCN